MATEIKHILINQIIEVDRIKIEPSEDRTVLTWLVLYDNLDLRIKKEDKLTGMVFLGSPIESNNTKTIWQKAQQQSHLVPRNKTIQNDKRYEEPFEDDGAYAE